jgi:hypothetical protein
MQGRLTISILTFLLSVFTVVFFTAPLSISAYSIETIPSDEVKNDFVVGPGKIELEVNPGESKTFEMLVTNRMGEPKTFILSTEDFEGSKNAEDTVVLLGDEQGPYSLRNYISFPETEFTLNHAERATIPVTVSVPANAEPGGLYGTVITQTISKKTETKQAKSTIVARIATLIFLRVPGETNVEGKLTDFETVSGKKFFSAPPIPFSLLFENTGSVHLTPYGEIRITNMFGREVGVMEADKWFAMPDSLRTREMSWQHPKFLFGKYTAVASINPGYGESADTLSFSFYVFPVKIILSVIAGIALLLVIFKLILSKFEIKMK